MPTKVQRFLESLGQDARLRDELRRAVSEADDTAFERVQEVLSRAGLSLDCEDLPTVTDHLLGHTPRPRSVLPLPREGRSRLEGLSGTFYLPSLPGWGPGQR